MINEKLLHYIWQYQLFKKSNLKTEEGDHLYIQKPGILNQDQGPDFLNATIKVAETLWVGSVEIHIKTSDWIHHQHSFDTNFNNVILHVVWEHDKNIDLPFPTLEISKLVPKIVIERYVQLMSSRVFIPCEKLFPTVLKIDIEKCKETMMVERLTYKLKRIEYNLNFFNNNWEACCWYELYKVFGGKVNGVAFQEIFKVGYQKGLFNKIYQHLQMESLLMGVGGLLNNSRGDEYYLLLKNEYEFLKKKYDLDIPKINLFFLRMHPSSFPTIKLSQLANFISKQQSIFQSFIHCNDVAEFHKYFKIKAQSYWDTHYVFNQKGVYAPKILGASSINNILINVVVPFIYAYGHYYGLIQYKNKAIDLLGHLQAESNAVIKKFKSLGVTIDSAQDSQSLIHLKKEYCDLKKCLDCIIGYSIFKK